MSDIKETEHGALLYQVWKKIRSNSCCEEWKKFGVFYEWVMENGYKIGTRINRLDIAKPFSPDNCVLTFPKCDSGRTPEERELIDAWNKTVNNIRKYMGMPPLEGT